MAGGLTPQQLYTPVAQRRVVLRATPATLTGVSGRPTHAPRRSQRNDLPQGPRAARQPPTPAGPTSRRSRRAQTASTLSFCSSYGEVLRQVAELLVCGRRWGKTSLLAMLAVNGALAGRSVGVFCPTYKFLGPLFEPIVSALRGLSGVRVNRTLGEIRLEGGGSIDFWSLDYTARAGRGRRYHLALIDEAAHDEGRLADSFPASIAPALMVFNGAVVTASTPNGLEGWFHDIAHDP